jgi:hypothetical protein
VLLPSDPHRKSIKSVLLPFVAHLLSLVQTYIDTFKNKFLAIILVFGIKREAWRKYTS